MSASRFPTTAPIATRPRSWAFPEVYRVVLPWGLHIAAVRMASLPLVTARWTFRGGRATEPDHRVGASHLLAAVARHGTERYSSQELAETLDFLGVRLRASVSLDQATVSATAQAGQLGDALDLCEEVAFRPSFPEAELARERASALEMHEHERAQPEQLSALWLSWLVYGHHPYGRPPTTASGLAATDRSDLLGLHRALFQPARAQLLVVGDIDPLVLLDRLAARYASPPLAPTDATAPLSAPSAPLRRRIIAVDRPGSEQVAVAMGQRLFARDCPDYLAMRVVNQVFGAGASSRLFLELRERRSLTYGAYSALDAGVAGGDFTTSLSCAPAKAREAVAALQEQIHRLVSAPISAEELDHATRNLVGSFPQKASGVGGIAGLVSFSWLHGLPADTWARYPADVLSIDAEAVAAAVRRWIRPEACSVVVVGPAEVVQAAVAGLDETEVELHSAAEPAFESGYPSGP